MADINICYAPNENYAGLAAVSMVSVLKNANFDDNINFIILYDKNNLNSSTIEKIKRVKEVRNCNIRFINLESKDFKDFPLANWVTTETWFRIKVTQLCPEYSKILYLDCDTAVLTSLKDLFDIDLGENFVGVVRDSWIKSNDKDYFNAGVILFNTEYCNKNNLFDKVKSYINSNDKSIKYGDQDILNKVTFGKKFILPCEYNYCENYFKKLDIEIMENPKIIHFVGPNPNRFDCRHSKKYIWEEYSKLTLFYNDFIEKNIYNMIKMYPKMKFDKFKYDLLSKILFGKHKEHYKVKSIVLQRIIDAMKF